MLVSLFMKTSIEKEAKNKLINTTIKIYLPNMYSELTDI